MKNRLVFMILCVLFSTNHIKAQNSSDNEFLGFWNDFKTAVNNKDKTQIELMTEYSSEYCGDFSSPTKVEFMDKVFAFLFEKNNLYGINNAKINQEVVVQNMGSIVLKKEIYDAQLSSFSKTDIVYSFEYLDIATKFKLINGKFKLIASYTLSTGD